MQKSRRRLNSPKWPNKSLQMNGLLPELLKKRKRKLNVSRLLLWPKRRNEKLNVLRDLRKKRRKPNVLPTKELKKGKKPKKLSVPLKRFELSVLPESPENRKKPKPENRKKPKLSKRLKLSVLPENKKRSEKLSVLLKRFKNVAGLQSPSQSQIQIHSLSQSH